MTEDQMNEGRVKVAAMDIAHKRLEQLGWTYTAKDIGTYASDIIIGLNLGLAAEEERTRG